jgi:hypothetical protein
LFDHPACRHDLAPSDYNLFSYMNNCLEYATSAIKR